MGLERNRFLAFQVFSPGLEFFSLISFYLLHLFVQKKSVCFFRQEKLLSIIVNFCPFDKYVNCYCEMNENMNSGKNTNSQLIANHFFLFKYHRARRKNNRIRWMRVFVTWKTKEIKASVYF